MAKWFGIGHGADNYEEQIDLDEVMFVRCTFKYLPDMPEELMWAHHAKIMFRNGRTEKVYFTAEGYKKFLERLGAEKDES